MMKVLPAIASLLFLLACPPTTEGGLLPGRHSSSVYYLVYNYRNLMSGCYNPEFDRQNELNLRKMYYQCFFSLSKNTTDREFLKNGKAVHHILSGFEKTPTENDIMRSFKTSPKAGDGPFYSASVIRALKNDLLDAQGLLSCVFAEMGLSVSTDGKVDGSALVQKYSADDSIPADVKQYLVEGVKSCSGAGGVNDMIWGKKYQGFFKKLNFYRCADWQKIFACMKVDLRNDADNYDLSGLDGQFDDLDDVSKMHLISYAYPNWEKTGLYDA